MRFLVTETADRRRTEAALVSLIFEGKRETTFSPVFGLFSAHLDDLFAAHGTKDSFIPDTLSDCVTFIPL